MEIAIVGLGHAFKKQYAALNEIKDFETIELCDKSKECISKYQCKEDYFNLASDNVIVATNPQTHLLIAKDLISLNKKIVLEKPIVTNLKELAELKTMVNTNNYFNSLHFSHGLEIDYFMNYINKAPKKIKAFISDPYVKDNHIIEKALNLCGSYLDEVINPLSAITRLFGYNVKFLKSEKKYYEGDKFDYYSKSNFLVNEIPVEIEVIWNEEMSQKYIDLFYDDFIIRLDSMNQNVVNLTTKEVLYQGQGDRMTNHYLGVFKDLLASGSNLDISLKLHEELLKGVADEN